MKTNSRSIGNKIAEARKKINLSQAELARQIAISPQAVGKWERGESMPDIAMLNTLAEIFRVDLNYFSESFHTRQDASVAHNRSIDPASENHPPEPTHKRGWPWDMSEATWVDADFSGLTNLKEKLSASHMTNCRLLGATLTELVLTENRITHCDFSGADMRNSQILGSTLSRSTFLESSLIDATCEGSEIKDCNFTKTDFSGAKFLTVHFQKNSVEGAVWKFTSFKATHLADVIFTSNLEECTFEHCTFSKILFKGMTFTNTFFKCKTLKAIQFEDCQADRMTYEFLKNGKADLSGLTVLP
jgi:uncharacterized protein YjbI with pentapeptide repeats